MISSVVGIFHSYITCQSIRLLRAQPSSQTHRAGYVYNNTPNDIRFASPENKAQFILLEKDSTVEGNYLIQGSGFYTFVGGHSYVPGYAYYLGADGKPTTDTSFTDGTRQHLFEAIDNSTILINVYQETEQE